MRTTINLEDHIHHALMALCKREKKTLGEKIAELVVLHFKPSQEFREKNGIPLLPARPGALPVTPETVLELLDEE